MTKKAVWTLPLNVHPAKSVDWCIPVPDDPYYRAAFWGALQNLASAYNWQDDPDHTAKQVALVWRDIIDGLEKCVDCPDVETGEEWEDTLAICESLRWNNGVLEGFCCGEWVPIPGADGGVVPGGVGQPTSAARPAPGASKCYNVLLNGNDEWQLPFNVQDGDTITVTDISGAWNDGTLNWYCAEGWPYILNTCVHSSRGHAGGDPDATDYHMQLIGNINGAYFPATDGPYTVPGGTGVQVLKFQANDGDLSDNRGSMKFSVCVENGTTPPSGEWCYIYDFTLDDYTWIPLNVGGDRAVYSPGLGWGPNPANYPGLIQITAAAFASTTITQVTVTLSAPMSGPTHTVDVEIPGVGSGAHLVVNNTDTEIPVDISPAIAGTSIFINIEDDDFSGASLYAGYLTRVTLRGTGSNPFGADNC